MSSTPKERLVLGDVDTGLPGSGVSLPAWFHPGPKRKPLGYHDNLGRWARVEDRTELKSVARGQEFVLNLDRYPEALPWIRETVAIAG
jgi:hypothetical protein